MSESVKIEELEKSFERFVRRSRIECPLGTFVVSTILLPTDLLMLDGLLGVFDDRYDELGSYETMVFTATGEGDDCDTTDARYMKKYDSLEAAKIGHQKILDKLKEGTLQIESIYEMDEE